MSPRLQAMIASAQDSHNKQYVDHAPDYDLTPMYFLYRGEQVHTVVALAGLPDDSNAKRAVVASVAAMAEQAACDGYAYSSEAYTLPPETAMLRLPNERFADRPDRIEVLIVEVGTKQGERALLMADITRDGVSAPTLSWRPPAVDGEGKARMESRFSLYNPQDPHYPHQMSATAH